MVFPLGTVGDTLVVCLRNCLCSNTYEIWILRILLYSSTLRNWPSRIGLNMILWIHLHLHLYGTRCRHT